MNRTNLIAGAAAALVMALAVLAFTVTDSDTDSVVATAPQVSTAPQDSIPPQVSTAPQDSTFSDLPTISADALPIEALDTLSLIEAGGPYPYRQDDGIFQNREGILPDRPEGHYREYTVDTPGSPDRGARRIVSGNDGERFYTDDHYDSFREIVDGDGS